MADDNLPHELDERPQARREWSGWLRSIVLPVAILVAIVGGLFYYDAQRRSDAKSDGFGTVALPADANASGRDPSATIGHAAPDFVLQTLDGGTLRLSDLQGQAVLVNFWATWCGSCRAEAPDLVEAYQKYRDQGFVLVAIDLREGTERVRSFVDEFELPYPIALDRNGEVAETWRIGGPNQGLPSSYFIDRDGIVRKVTFGLLTPKTLDEGIGLILAAGN